MCENLKNHWEITESPILKNDNDFTGEDKKLLTEYPYITDKGR